MNDHRRQSLAIHFGGSVKPANAKTNRRDRHLSENQSGKRQVVIAMRARRRAQSGALVAANVEAGERSMPTRLRNGTPWTPAMRGLPKMAESYVALRPAFTITSQASISHHMQLR